MHTLHDATGSLPGSAICDKNGKPLLSWRVALLPYIEEHGVYDEFHLDEPWDSPHNIKLLSRMPSVYAPFNGKKTPEPYTTYYQVFTGPGTPFEQGKTIRLGEIEDGTSKTIGITEAWDPVPWTKPADMEYAPDKPLPKVGGIFADRITVFLLDGTVRGIKKTVSETTLRALITRNGKETIATVDIP